MRSIVPASGAMNVDPSAPIVIVFNHPMMAGGQMAVALHDGTITGPVVDGTATWSSDHTRLTFTQRQPLKSRTAYIIHLSPTLADSTGRLINYAHCAAIFGGQPVSGSSWGMMMGGGMMGRGMTGPGWQAGGGPWGYGMWLAFTTA